MQLIYSEFVSGGGNETAHSPERNVIYAGHQYKEDPTGLLILYNGRHSQDDRFITSDVNYNSGNMDCLHHTSTLDRSSVRLRPKCEIVVTVTDINIPYHERAIHSKFCTQGNFFKCFVKEVG